jgi:hypothetical protein
LKSGCVVSRCFPTCAVHTLRAPLQSERAAGRRQPVPTPQRFPLRLRLKHEPEASRCPFRGMHHAGDYWRQAAPIRGGSGRRVSLRTRGWRPPALVGIGPLPVHGRSAGSDIATAYLPPPQSPRMNQCPRAGDRLPITATTRLTEHCERHWFLRPGTTRAYPTANGFRN